MSWIKVECELGHRQAIVFRPPREDQPEGVTEGHFSTTRPNETIVIYSDYGERDIEGYHHIVNLVPQRCGVCGSMLTHSLEEGDGPVGADDGAS